MELGSDPDLELSDSSPELLERLVTDLLYRHSESGAMDLTESRDIARILVRELG